jgi:putative Ca2+/H+ antiporter (TMEM165/GDT1 family)
LWFPQLHQIRMANNENWLQSVWLGTGWTFLHLPHIVFFFYLVPLLATRTLRVAIGGLWLLILATFKLFVYGVMGGLNSEDVTIEESMRRLKEQQGMRK